MNLPPLSIGKGLPDPKEKAVANSIASQNGMIKNPDGSNPVIDYIVKKQIEANKSSKAKHTHEHYTTKGKN